MNRIIKFRAWNKTNKKIIHAGEYVEENELMVSFSGKITEEHNNHACGDDDCCGPNENYLSENSKNYILMQFTGLLDKNGKEIYEGDILKGGNGNVEKICEVIFENGAFFGTKKNDNVSSIGLIAWFPCEIIGNIYESSDLIK